MTPQYTPGLHYTGKHANISSNNNTCSIYNPGFCTSSQSQPFQSIPIQTMSVSSPMRTADPRAPPDPARVEIQCIQHDRRQVNTKGETVTAVILFVKREMGHKSGETICEVGAGPCVSFMPSIHHRHDFACCSLRSTSSLRLYVGPGSPSLSSVSSDSPNAWFSVSYEWIRPSRSPCPLR